MTNSKFLKISCPRCRHEQILFGKASTLVKCKKCNITLNKTRGGKARIKAEVRQIL